MTRAEGGHITPRPPKHPPKHPPKRLHTAPTQEDSPTAGGEWRMASRKLRGAGWRTPLGGTSGTLLAGTMHTLRGGMSHMPLAGMSHMRLGGIQGGIQGGMQGGTLLNL